jgi:hypothetical protein
MERITITRPQALRLAQAATSKEDYQRIFRGILFRPDGTLVGTDGFCLAYGRNACEGATESVVVRFEKSIPRFETGVVDLVAGVFRYKTNARSAEKSMLVEVLEGSFPDWERVLPTGPDQVLTTTRNVLNPEIMVRLMKPLGSSHPLSAWRFRGGMGYLRVDDETEAILVPLRTEEHTFEAQEQLKAA